MRPHCLKLTAILMLAAPAAAPAAPAEDPLPAGLEEEVRALNGTLGELVELLRRQLESSNAAVLMQRVQLMTSRMAPLEQELRSARSEQDRLQGQMDELEMARASFETQVEREREEGEIDDDEARDQLDRQRPLVDQRRRQLEERLWAVQQRVIDLEQGLAAGRAEIETWEAEIDRALGLR